VSGIVDELSEAWKQGKRLVEITLELRQISLTIAASEGRFNRIIAEQRGILQDVNKSNAERLKAGELAIIAQDNFNKLKQQELDKQIEELKIKQAQNDTDAKGIEELARLGAEKDQAEADAANKKREIQNIINGLIKKSADDAKKDIAERAEAEREMYENGINSIQEILNQFDLLIEKRNEVAPDGVLFKIFDEEEIDDIPQIIESLGELANEEVALAQATTDKIKGTYTQRLEALRASLQAGLISEEQYANRKKEINGLILEDSIASLRGVAKEGSAISRGLFVFEKILAAKKALMAIIAGTAETAKVGFPQNIPLLIGFAAQVSGLVGAIKGVTAPEPPKFAGGVIGLQGSGTSTSDSIKARLSKGESVLTAKATTAFAPVLAQMEMAVGNKPNFQLGSRRFANGLIGSPVTDISIGYEKLIRQTVEAIGAIPVVVSETDITSTQNNVRKIKVTGDL
jgi:hypothetical protein